jgi:hypothetical protein
MFEPASVFSVPALDLSDALAGCGQSAFGGQLKEADMAYKARQPCFFLLLPPDPLLLNNVVESAIDDRE